MMNSSEDDAEVPVISIQCDWDAALRETGGHAWISARVKDKPSIQGKIFTESLSNVTPAYKCTNGFKAEFLSKSSIKVVLPDGSHCAVFVAPLITYSEIHKKSITSLDITSTGLAVSSDTDMNVVVWNISMENKKLNLEGHVGEVYKTRFFPSEKVILTCGSDMRIKIWCAVTGACPVTMVGHTQAVTDVAIVDRGRNILSVSKDGTGRLWHCGTGTCIATVCKADAIINCCDIHDAPNNIGLDEPEQPESDLEVSTNGKLFLIGCEDGLVQVLGLSTRQIVLSFSVDSPVNAVAFLTEQYFLVGCQNGAIYLYSLVDQEKLQKAWHYSNSPVLCLLRLKDGFVVSRSDGSVHYIDPNKFPKSLVGLTGSDCDPVYSLAAEGQFIYTCCRDAVVRKYRIDLIKKFC